MTSLIWSNELGRYVDGTTAAETFGELLRYQPVYGEWDTKYGVRTRTITFANDNRRGEFMQTYSGRKFWPLDPRADEIHIEDIAHALAHQCRYGGHCERFYSVAEHSVLMSRVLSGGSRNMRLWALLHDAAEAYIADVPRPLKRQLVGYKEAEDRLLAVIAEKYGLTAEMPYEVKLADERILADEIRQNMRPMAWHDDYDNPLGVTLQFWDPERAEDEFLIAFWDLQDRRGAA